MDFRRVINGRVMLLGKGLDQISSKESAFTLIGMGLGFLIFAIIVLKSKKQ